MPIEFPTLNFAALSPILIVIVTAFLVMLLELFVSDKRVLGYFSLAGLIIAAVASFMMFGLPAASPGALPPGCRACRWWWYAACCSGCGGSSPDSPAH